MKRHIKGFNIIRLILACVIGIGAMNIGLISADDTRLVDEEAVKIEEVMSIGDDVSMMSEASSLVPHNSTPFTESYSLNSSTNPQSYTILSYDIYYNGKLWGKTKNSMTFSSSTPSRASNIINWMGMTNMPLTGVTSIDFGTYITEAIINSDGTITVTYDGTNNRISNTYIALQGTENFGDTNNLTPHNSTPFTESYSLNSSTNPQSYSILSYDIYYNGKLWGKTKNSMTFSSSTPSRASNIINWMGMTNMLLTGVTSIEFGAYITEAIINSDGTITVTYDGTNNRVSKTYIALQGTENFGIDNSYGGGFGSSSAMSYEISKGSTSNGSFVVASTAYEDTTVTVGTTPNTGYKLNSVSVPGASNIVISGNNATFTMPGAIFLFI